MNLNHFYIHPHSKKLAYKNSELSQDFLTSLVSVIKNESKVKYPSLPEHIQSNIILQNNSSFDKTLFSQVKMVLFDIYGTLLHASAGDINQEHSNAETVKNFTVKELHIDIPSKLIKQLLKTYIKISHSNIMNTKKIQYPEIDAIELWRTLSSDKEFNHAQLSIKEAALCAVKYELYNNPSWPMPNAVKILNKLYKAGYKLGIVSNAQFYTPIFLSAFFYGNKRAEENLLTQIKFEPQIWSYMLAEAKPSPKLFELALKSAHTYHIDAKEILYIGNDLKNDIAPAQQLGMRTLLFAGDSLSYRPRSHDSTLFNIKPDGIITDLNVIFSLLDKKHL